MADKRIQDLTPATSVQATDRFVLEQSGQAKSLTGQILVNDLAVALDGHGGISNIVYSPPVSPSLTGTMTITLADNTQYTVSIRDGNGIKSIAIAYAISNTGTSAPGGSAQWSSSPVEPTDAQPFLWTRIRITDMTNAQKDAYSVSKKADSPTISIGTVTAATGVSAGATVSNSGSAYNPVLDFSFTMEKGDKGDTGDYVDLVVSYGTSTAAATEPSTWYSSPTSLSYTAGNFIWQKTEYQLHDAGTVQRTEEKIIGYIGQNGSGSGTVSQITFNGTVFADDGTGNVPMTVDADEVGAIANPGTKSNGQVLTYDSSADEWVAANPATGNVNTVNNVGVTAGTTNVQLYATSIPMSSTDGTSVKNAIPLASSANPQPLGTASAGSATTWSKGDHVHPFPEYIHVGASAPSDSNIDIWLDTDDPGQSTVSSVNGKSGTVLLDAADVGAMAVWELVWENATASSSFAAQPIPLDLIDYDAVWIYFARATSTLDDLAGSMVLNGKSYSHRVVSNSSSSIRYYARNATVSSSGVEFGACTYHTQGSSSATTENVSLVPVYIYGIKGVEAV